MKNVFMLSLVISSLVLGHQEIAFSQEDKTRNQLTVRSKFLFPGNPVADIIPFIEAGHRIQFDTSGAGANLNREVSIEKEGLTYHLLTELLEQAQLKWIGRGGVIYVKQIPPGYPMIDPKSASNNIVSVMNRLIDFDQDNPTTEDVISSMEDLFSKTEVKIQVDTDQIVKAGIDITQKLKESKATSVAKYIFADALYQANLTWTIQDKQILIIPNKKTNK